MNILSIHKIVLLLSSTCLLRNKVAALQEDTSYVFYQNPGYPRDCKEALNQCASNNSSGVYTIKPDGYPQPFEVYCSNDISSGGWTLIQRHIDSIVTFKRNWTDYVNGFGFLSTEFWIGHDRLSYITNQAVYELRIDMVLPNGSSFYIKYSSFRISDEQGDYAIVSAEGFRSNFSCVVSTCPLTTTQETCTCQTLCTDPIEQSDCFTDCIETCAPEGCLVTETNTYILNGESYINTNCTQNCTCVDNQASCSTDYECSVDATCRVQDDIRKCYCNEGYSGDGEICVTDFRDCYEAYHAGHTTDGVYTILPIGWKGSPFTVFCDMTTNGGGWTLIQRRIDGVTHFYRNWNEYKQGFGIREGGNDFWLGNEQIYYLTNQKGYKLRVDIVTSSGSEKYAEYTSFQIGDVTTKYQLSIGTYSGNADDGMRYTNGRKFSTRDQDNDNCLADDFAKGHKGGWWYSDAGYGCQSCHLSYCNTFAILGNSCKGYGAISNLNGQYNGDNGKNVFWYYHYNCHLNSAEMKIRPSSV